MKKYTPFGELLIKYQRDSDMSMNKIANMLETSSGFLSNVCSGARKPNIELVNRFVDFFELTGDDKAKFIAAALIEDCPRSVRDVFYEIDEDTRLILSKLIAKRENH